MRRRRRYGRRGCVMIVVSFPGREVFNLIYERFLRVDMTDGSLAVLSLPELLAALCTDRSVGLRSLRPFHAHAFHAFVARLMACTLGRVGRRVMPSDASAWRDMLMAVPPGHDERVWDLVGSAADMPAFLQPAVLSCGESVGRGTEIPMPDGIDVLSGRSGLEVGLPAMWGLRP